MKKIMGREIKCIIVIISIIFLVDYINLPSKLGLTMSNINWDFSMGAFNIIVVVILYIVTFKTLDRRTIERENNKIEISTLLLKECYNECLWYVKYFDKEIVDKYVVPKIDFNSTDHAIIKNLQSAPFLNENAIIDFAKDGQITKERLEGYFNVRKRFREYIGMRIMLYDGPEIYEPLKINLYNTINSEIKNLKVI
ncbi:hypothetical protein [Lacrimispora indolis]|uniref:hypothetical protein n=1 Tax=Lacrimispora indolis TaxID=69825 RepID=UPI0004626F3A|nr:hypothetical protein [[Clostridium] methoxybenzovorans]